MNKKMYVAGFCFSERHDSVVLIKKARPHWQSGFLNGIGGKIEEGETPLQAMVREFEEETGVKTQTPDWTKFVVLSSRDNSWCVMFYKCINTLHTMNACQTTDEPLFWVDPYDLDNHNVLPKLHWLIPMAICVCNPISSGDVFVNATTVA